MNDPIRDPTLAPLATEQCINDVHEVSDGRWRQMRKAATLNLQIAPSGTVDAETVRRLGELEGIERLRLGEVACDAIVPLLNLPILRELSFSSAELTDQHLSEICRRLSDLRSLEISDELRSPNSLTNDGLQCLESLSHLRRFSLGGANRITDAGLAKLLRMRSLRELSLSDCGICCEEIQSGPVNSPLEKLFLQQCPVGDTGMSHLAGCPLLTDHMRTLAVSRSAITDQGLKSIARFEQLTALHLDGNNICGPGLAHLGSLARLEHLWLDFTTLNEDSLKSLPPLPALKTLSVDDAGIHTVEGLLHLKNQPVLKDVTILPYDIRNATAVEDACGFEVWSWAP